MASQLYFGVPLACWGRGVNAAFRALGFELVREAGHIAPCGVRSGRTFRLSRGNSSNGASGYTTELDALPAGRRSVSRYSDPRGARILGGRHVRGRRVRAGRGCDVPLAAHSAALRLPAGAAVVCRILGLAAVVDRADGLPFRDEDRLGALDRAAGGFHLRPGSFSGPAGAPLVPLRHALVRLPGGGSCHSTDLYR